MNVTQFYCSFACYDTKSCEKYQLSQQQPYDSLLVQWDLKHTKSSPYLFLVFPDVFLVSWQLECLLMSVQKSNLFQIRLYHRKLLTPFSHVQWLYLARIPFNEFYGVSFLREAWRTVGRGETSHYWYRASSWFDKPFSKYGNCCLKQIIIVIIWCSSKIFKMRQLFL